MVTQNINLIKTPRNLVINSNGWSKTIPVGPLADKVFLMYKEGKTVKEIREIADPTFAINASGVFSVINGRVCYNNETLPDSLSDRIVEFQREGVPFQPLIKFWENCKLNPDPRAKTDLYKFLEHNGHPITTDGCFIAYRSVKRDDTGKLVDWNTGKFDNSIGNVVRMNRDECDNNPDQTCSRGLHIAAEQYAVDFNAYESRVLLEVKVNPKNVVAIPTDYNGQKMRVCEFEVVCEHIAPLKSPLYDAHNLPVDDSDDDDSEYDDSEDDSDPYKDVDLDVDTGTDFDVVIDVPLRDVQHVPMRDKNGRFLSGSAPKRDSYGRFI